MRSILSALAATLLLGSVLFLDGQGRGGGKGAPPPQNLKILTANGFRPMMDVFVASLGVADQGGCLYCHTMPGDFASDANPRKNVARDMLRMVKSINEETFEGQQKVTCYTCHRGSPVPPAEAP